MMSMIEYSRYNTKNHWKGETLKVFFAPDGNNKEMIKLLEFKTERWVSLLKSGRLGPHDSWQALETTIMKSTICPLPALTLSAKDCNT